MLVSGAPFHTARVVSSVDETPTMRAIRLEVAPTIAASHREAGQFVEVRLPGHAGGGYFALANAPDGEGIELLVKRGEGLPDELVSLPVGALVETTPAMGAGFPVEAMRGRDVLLFATGSGIAPIRAVLQALVKDRAAYGRIELFFGVRTEGELPYSEDLDAFEREGVRVHRVLSRPERSDRGHARWVQERFREELPPVANAVACLCGLEGMIRGVSEALGEAGLGEDRIYLNL